MKTIKKGNEIKRVSDNEVIKMIKVGWEYCPKKLWKEGKKNKPVIGLDDTTDNMSEKKKRKLRKENKRKKYENK